MRESDYGRNWYLSYLCSLVKPNKTIINRFNTCMLLWHQVQRKFLWKAMMTSGRWWHCLRLWGMDISCHHNYCTRGKQTNHPKFSFPEDYNVFHSDLSLWQKRLCILDVFAAHRSNEFLNVMAIKKYGLCPLAQNTAI